MNLKAAQHIGAEVSLKEQSRVESEGESGTDAIIAILEEVINRCESKIDLFCSGRSSGSKERMALYSII